MILFSVLFILAGAFSCLAASAKIGGFLPTLKPTEVIGPGAVPEASSNPAIQQSISQATVTLKPGGTLFSAMTSAGVPAAEAARYLAKLNGQIDVHRLQPGDRLTLAFVTEGNRRRFVSLTLSGERNGRTSVSLLPNFAKPESRPVDVATVLKTMVVHGGPALSRALTESGLPPEVCEQVILALSQASRPPVHGEMVKIVYQMPIDPATGPVPQLRYATYAGRDGKQHVYNYMRPMSPGSVQRVVLTAVVMVSLGQPLPGARISSPFGWRLHPVLHTVLFHKGVDYEAPMGTPVVAAADGVVEDVGRRGTYGNYIRLRHSPRLETAYAHLSGFAPALEAGTQVHRGDIIGYVGMTGIATGPHLYYELLVDGRQIDPESEALKEAMQRRTPQTASLR